MKVLRRYTRQGPGVQGRRSPGSGSGPSALGQTNGAVWQPRGGLLDFGYWTLDFAVTGICLNAVGCTY